MTKSKIEEMVGDIVFHKDGVELKSSSMSLMLKNDGIYFNGKAIDAKKLTQFFEAIELQEKQCAHLSLINHALEKEWLVTVGSEGEVDLSLSSDKEAILAAIDAVGAADVTFWKKVNGGPTCRIGWAYVFDQGEPEGSVVDFTSNDHLNEWWDKFHEED